MALFPPPPSWAPPSIDPMAEDMPAPPLPTFDPMAGGIGGLPGVPAPDERPTPALPPPPLPGEPFDADDIEIEPPAPPLPDDIEPLAPPLPDDFEIEPPAPPLPDDIEMSAEAGDDAPEARAGREAELAAKIRGAELAPFGPLPAPPLPGDDEERPTPTLESPDDVATRDDVERMAGSEKTTNDLEDDAAAMAEAERWAKVSALADLDPEAWAKITGEHQLKSELERATRERVIAQQEKDLLEANHNRRETARAAARQDLDKMQGEAKALADGSPFAQWWSTRSTAQKAAGYLAAIIGGFLASRNGGRNTSLDLFMKVADDEATARWASLRERRGLAEGKLGAADDDFRAQEAYRIASREQAIRQMEAELASLDPQGTQALRLAGAVREARAQQGALAQQYQAAAFDRADKVLARDQEQQRIEIERAKAQAEIAKKLGLGGGAGKAKHPPAYFVQQYGLDPKDAPPVPMTDKEFDKYRQVRRDMQVQANAAAGEQRAVDEADRTKKAAADAKVINDPFTGKPLGSIVGATDPRTLQEALDAGTTVIKTVDKLRRLAAKAEGASDYVKSAEWQEIKATQSFLTGVLGKALQLGALDKGLIEVTDKMMGSTDPTSFIYNADAGLAMAKSNFEGRARDMLRGAGIDDAAWSVPDMGKLPRPKKDVLGGRLSAEQSFDQRAAAMRRKHQGQLDQATLRVDVTGGEPKVAFDNEDDSAEYDKDALDQAEAAIARGDEDAAVQAANIVIAAGSSQNRAMRKNAALRLRTLLKAKDPTVLKAFADAGRSKMAAALASLPAKEAKAAFAELFPDTDDNDDGKD